jgi:hypothetical protein
MSWTSWCNKVPFRYLFRALCDDVQLCNHCVREFLILARTWFAFGLPSKTGCDNKPSWSSHEIMKLLWRSKVCTHSSWQLSWNNVKILSEPLHMISWYLDKFHDFLTLFVFYIILKQLDRKVAVMFREHVVLNFWLVPKLGHNLFSITLISFFPFTIFHFRVTYNLNLNYPNKFN